MAAEKTAAIILRVTEFSETSCVASVLTRDFGKQSVIAKGARRPKSPFEASLDLLAVSRIVFIPKRGEALGILTEAKLVQRFRNRRGQMAWLYAAYYVVELLRLLTEEGDSHPELFDLSLAILRMIDPPDLTPQPRQQSKKDGLTPESGFDHRELDLTLLRFEAGLLQSLGLFPMLSHCASCGRQRKTSNQVVYAAEMGGIVCPQCAANLSQLIPVSNPLMDLLERWQKILVDRMVEHKHPQQDHSWPAAGLATFSNLLIEGHRSPSENLLAELRRLINQHLWQRIGFIPRLYHFLKPFLSEMPASTMALNPTGGGEIGAESGE